MFNPNCPNNIEHNLDVRCRRLDTTAIWVSNCDALLCYEHADQGYTINITLTPQPNKEITTNINACGHIKTRTTPILHDSQNELWSVISLIL